MNNMKTKEELFGQIMRLSRLRRKKSLKVIFEGRITWPNYETLSVKEKEILESDFEDGMKGAVLNSRL